MSRKPYVPAALRLGPFTREKAMSEGLTSRQLQGSHFRRLFPCVYVWRGHVMTESDWIIAAKLAMPEHAHLSHLTRVRELGLDIGPLRPFHFTMAGDLHLDVPDIFLHRTAMLPPLDAAGVSPAAAFIQHADTARLIDLIIVGDWLLHRGSMTVLEVAELANRDHWRPGAANVLRVLSHLDGRARSVKESETRALLVFAGLPVPGVNEDVLDGSVFLGCVDLLYREWHLIVEYEGRQHAEDAYQFNRDIGRYAGLRGNGWEYVQVTQAMLGQPRALVRHVHTKLVERGYRGREPVFQSRWRRLFEPVTPPTSRERWASNRKTAK